MPTKVLGRCQSGVVLINIGSHVAYAVDLSTNRYAYIGDDEGKLVRRTPLTPINKSDDVTTVRLAAERVLANGKKVDLAFVPFTKADGGDKTAEKRTCDKDTKLEDDEECVDGYIEKKKKENPFADGGNPFS